MSVTEEGILKTSVPYDGTLFSLRKEGGMETLCVDGIMLEADTKAHGPCDSIYTKCLEQTPRETKQVSGRLGPRANGA